MAFCVSECVTRKRTVDVGAREEGMQRDGGVEVTRKEDRWASTPACVSWEIRAT